MNYELAKKLKDAGFPQDTRFKCCPCSDFTVEKNGSWVCMHGNNTKVACPALHELIEACGVNERVGFELFQSWTKDKIYWEACILWPKEKKAITEGSTPEEAVANLWLVLNEKKK